MTTTSATLRPALLLPDSEGDQARPGGSGAAPAASLQVGFGDGSHVARPWRWTSVALAPFELIAVAWSIPFIVLAVGLPIVALIALIHRLLILVGRTF